MPPPLRLALISGGMYDALNARIAAQAAALCGSPVEFAFTGDHVALNHELAAPDSGQRYDLVSTHSKYAPAQGHALAPLDALLTPAELADFSPAVLSLARVGGRLLGLPRNLDIRLLHYRTDLLKTPPATWEELIAAAASVRAPGLDGFVFPGRESGLFGTFFELAEMGGTELFPVGRRADLRHPGARWALQLLRALYCGGLVPAALTEWHYDAVHAHYRAGRAALVGDWPGYYASYSEAGSPVADKFSVCAYPAGPTGRSLSYGGSHTFALTPRGASRPEALALLRWITGQEQQLSEARAGSVPVRASVMAKIRAEASPEQDRRWAVLENVIRDGLLVPPKFPAYPALEEHLWKTVQAAMTGALPIEDALAHMTHELHRLTPADHAPALPSPTR